MSLTTNICNHLLIAIGIQTTGNDYENDEIHEIAAKLVPPTWLNSTFESPITFHSLVKTKRINVGKNSIRYKKNDEGVDYTIALNNFIEWLQFVVREARSKTNSYLVTALIGHFALWNEFKFLVKYCENDIIGLWCQFADSGDLLSKLKKMNLWEKNTPTNLKNLYLHITHQNLPNKLNAIEKADALAAILSSPTFTPFLQYLDLHTYQGFKLKCEKDKSSEKYFDDLMDNFGPDLVYIELLHRMAHKRISFQHIQNAFWSSRNSDIFSTKMKKKHFFHLDSDEANELYFACKRVAKVYNCCIHFANKMPKTSLKYK